MKTEPAWVASMEARGMSGAGNVTKLKGRGRPTDDSGDDHPTIDMKVGKIGAVVDQAQKALIAADLGLYQRGATIVLIGDAKVITPAEGEVSIHRIFECGDHALLEQMNVAARFRRFDKRSEEWVMIDAPTKVAHTLKDRKGRLRFPVLSGLIDAPTLRPDGSVLDVPGYDATTGLFLNPTVAFGEIPRQPTGKQAEAALHLLVDLVATFPFETEADRAAAISAMLTVCIRRSLRTAPMHAFTAPAAGSGKSMLAGC